MYKELFKNFIDDTNASSVIVHCMPFLKNPSPWQHKHKTELKLVLYSVAYCVADAILLLGGVMYIVTLA